MSFIKRSGIAVGGMLLLYSCSTVPRSALAGDYPTGSGDGSTLSQSLFTSDTSVLSNDAVEQILHSHIRVQDGSTLGILKIPSKNSIQRYYGYYYWRSEKFLETQEKINLAIVENVKSRKISTTKYIPPMLIPEKMSIPLIRESAARLQANLVLVYKLESNIFQEFRLFQSEKIRA